MIVSKNRTIFGFTKTEPNFNKIDTTVSSQTILLDRNVCTELFIFEMPSFKFDLANVPLDPQHLGGRCHAGVSAGKLLTSGCGSGNLWCAVSGRL